MHRRSPLTVPSQFTVGDTWRFTLDIPDYPRPQWTAAIYLENKNARLSASSEGVTASHEFSIAAAITAAYMAGDYRWTVRVSDGIESHTLESGWLTVLPDPAAAVSSDPRSWARRTLEAIEATLEQRATSDQLSYQIQGRALSRIPLPELIQWRDKLRGEIRAERSAQKNGLGRNLQVRFKRG